MSEILETPRAVYVVDDEAGVRDSLSLLIASNGMDARVFPSATAFLDAEPDLPPGVVLTDVRMPGMSGLELIQALRTRERPRPAVVMTAHADVPLAVEALRSGAIDLLEKPFDPGELFASLETARARLARHDADERRRQDCQERLSRLTARERDVFDGVVAGKTSKLIARDLDISPRTVDVYRAAIMSKTGSTSVAELVALSMAAA